jgi:hypothetical protein
MQPAAVDALFAAYLREAALDEVDRHRAEQARVMSVSARVRFENIRTQCEEHMLRSAEVLSLFWTELSGSSPSLSRLSSLGLGLQRSSTAAIAAFDRMLRLNPSSSTIMYRYAEFLNEVTGGVTVAVEVLCDWFASSCVFCAVCRC